MTRTHEFNLTGAARKPLIEAIESFTNTKGVYQGAPKFGYAFHGVGVLDKAGALHLNCDMQVIMDLITWLENCGFACTDGVSALDTPEAPDTVPEFRTYQAELSDPDCPDRMEIFSAEDDADAVLQAREFCEGEVILLELFELDDDCNQIRAIDLSEFPTGLALAYPLDGFTPEKLDNLNKLVSSKEVLIKKALGIDDLPIKVTADSIAFPWFPADLDGDSVKAYSQLVCALCNTAKEKKRVSAKAQESFENERFAMRVWLIGLGLSGKEYGLCRKLMSKNLTGNSAFRYGKPDTEADSE